VFAFRIKTDPRLVQQNRHAIVPALNDIKETPGALVVRSIVVLRLSLKRDGSIDQLQF
jgi:hypothetical protein